MFSTRRNICVIIAVSVLTSLDPTRVLGAIPDAPPQVPWTAVKLHVKNVTARQALDEITKQTNLTFQAEIPAFEDQLNDVRVSLDLDGEPLMKAVVAVCDAADLRPVGYLPDKPGLKLGNHQGAWNVKCTDVRGAFAVGVIRVEQNLQIDYGTRPNPMPRMFGVYFCVCPEPNVHAQRVTSLRLTKCLDETNLPIPDLGSPSATAMAPGLPMVRIRCLGNRLSLVEGEYTVLTEKDRKHIDLPNVLNVRDLSQTLGNAHLQIRSLARNGRQYVLQVLIRRDDMDDDQIKKVADILTANAPQFFDGAGKNAGLQQASSQVRPVPTGSVVSLTFNPTPGREEPSKMTWDLPTDTVEVTVPFSIRDVPLPGPPMPASKAIVAAPTTLPAVAKLDVEKEVHSLLPQLSAVTVEDRQDALIRLQLLPPTAFTAVEKIANDAQTPPAARQQLALYLRQRRPLQAARLRRAKVVQDEHNWEEAASLDAYGRFGKRDPKWDAKVRDAIHLYYQSERIGADAQVRQALEAAVEAGCEDPLVLSLTGFVIEKTGGVPRQILKLYQQANDDIRVSQYPGYFRLWVLIRYYSLLNRTSSAETQFRGERFLPQQDTRVMAGLRVIAPSDFADSARINPPPSLMLKSAIRVLNINDLDGVDIEKVYHQLAAVMDTLFPNRPEPLVLKGVFYTDWAWAARGSGTADTVTKQGWKRFAERLAAAEEALTKAYQLDPTDPSAPTQMLTVELGQGKGRLVMERWYARALEADPDNFDACQRKLSYLEPKWHGSAEEMLAFGEECYKSGNYLGRFPMLLGHVHSLLKGYTADPHAYMRQPQVWQDVKKIYEPYLRVRPDDVDARSAYCAFAGYTNHWAVAKEQLDILGENALPEYFGWGTIEDLKAFKKQAQSNGKANVP